MKNLGLFIAFVGICLVGGTVVFTPSHSFNVVDSNNGVAASAAMFFGSLIVFGAGVVILANAIVAERRKKQH
jgi:hypothetical protein